MRFDTSIPYQRENAIVYIKQLLDDKARFEIKKIHPKRSNQQNSYLHVLFSMYGLNFGLTLEEAKQDIKIDLGYTYEKNGKTYLKSTVTDSKTLTDFIEAFRNLSASRGKYLPSPNEISDNDLNEIERNQVYLTGKFY